MFVVVYTYVQCYLYLPYSCVLWNYCRLNFVSEYSREATRFTKSTSGRLLFTRVSQELVRQIISRMKYNYGLLFVLRFYGRINSQYHVEPISHPLTLLLGRIRNTKWLTSTVVTDNYHWVITTESTMFQSFQAVSKELGHWKRKIG